MWQLLNLEICTIHVRTEQDYWFIPVWVSQHPSILQQVVGQTLLHPGWQQLLQGSSTSFLSPESSSLSAGHNFGDPSSGETCSALPSWSSLDSNRRCSDVMTSSPITNAFTDYFFEFRPLAWFMSNFMTIFRPTDPSRNTPISNHNSSQR